MPVEKLENGEWLHAYRLPLGAGWSGHCTAPGHENTAPSSEQLRDFCNLGYAERCDRLPPDRSWDSIRFGARTLASGEQNSVAHVHIRYVCERNHRPVDHGTLTFDPIATHWQSKHADLRVQRMAECYLASYLEKRKKLHADSASDLTPAQRTFTEKTEQ